MTPAVACISQVSSEADAGQRKKRTMKRVRAAVGPWVVLVIAAVGIQQTSHAREMIHNGGFEAGVSGWEQRHHHGSGTLGVRYATSTDVRPGSTGLASLQIETTPEFNCSNNIRQQVTGLEGGKRYRMSIWYKVVSGGDPDGPVDSAVARDMKNDTNADRVDMIFDMTVDDTWKCATAEVKTAPSTTADDFYRMMIQIDPRDEGGRGGVIRVDDFSLLEAEQKATDDNQEAAYAGEAQGAMSKLLARLSGPAAKKSGSAEAGIMDGFPYLRSDKAVYLWARAEHGSGLLKVRDRDSGADLLAANKSNALLWTVDARGPRGEHVPCDNAAPCKVSSEAAGGEAKLVFEWTGDVRVAVEARLAADSALLRTRIRVDTVKEDVGLHSVTFPIVGGIKPLAENADDDRVLCAFRSGFTRASPLTTGEALSMRYNINYYMQFTALLGAGRGLYLGEHDGTAAWKEFDWTPDVDAQTLGYSVSHPVLNWGADEPVRHYESPGDCVLGPFRGDWYDAARIYRGWARTAPWSAKGPMHARDDYPNWFLNINYWVCGHIDGTPSQMYEFGKRDLFDFPITVTHDYGYYGQPYQHDLDPEYFPPRPGSVNYQRTLKDLRARGARVIPYVMGWMWNGASEDYRRRGAKEKGAMLGEDRTSVLWAELSPGEECIAMCPASQIWRDKLTEVSVEFVQRYRTGGVYFDYFSTHMSDCHNPDHGHAMGGGDYWSRNINGLYKEVREAVHEIDPEAMFCGENLAEFCNDVLDAHYESSYHSNAPVWQVVYHDYVQVLGGMHWLESKPIPLGRQFLYGQVNQLPGGVAFPDTKAEETDWYRKLLRCHHEFARPYLGYGEMLRPPAVSGDLPTLTMKGSDAGSFTARAVEGTAWRAADGSVGIFFFNYEKEAHRFTWETDLAEIAGFDAATRLQMTQWTATEGEKPMARIDGGVVGDTMEIPPLGLIALKLNVRR